MSDEDRPARRGVVATVGRISILRILFMGIALLIGEGLIFAFHGAYGGGHIAIPYSALADYGVSALACFSLVGVYALLVRWLERRWPREARPSTGWTLLGVVVGVGLFCAVSKDGSVIMMVSVWRGVAGCGGGGACGGVCGCVGVRRWGSRGKHLQSLLLLLMPLPPFLPSGLPACLPLSLAAAGRAAWRLPAAPAPGGTAAVVHPAAGRWRLWRRRGQPVPGGCGGRRRCAFCGRRHRCVCSACMQRC